VGNHVFPSVLRTPNDELLKFLCGLLDDYSDEVRCDARALKFAMPVGICALASACHQLHRREQTVFFDNLAPHLESFLERMDVFEHCHVEHIDRPGRLRREESLVEVKRIDQERDIPLAAKRLAQTMTGHLMRGLDQDQADRGAMHQSHSEHVTILLSYILVELLENALTHARFHGFGHSSVWVAAAHFPKTNEVGLAFVDDGCGFLKSLGEHEEVREVPTDIVAIQAALRPFVSRNRAVGILDNPSNQGIGLTMSRDIVVRSDGTINVTSGSGMVRDGGDGIESRRLAASWQGSLIEARLRRDALINVGLASIASQYERAPKPKLLYE
jgi:signal transduction histidine kinase